MQEELKYWYLKDHKLFDKLSDEEYAGLCIISNFKHGNKNDIISFSDTGIQRLYVLKEGTLKICRQEKNTREVIVEILTRHDIFGCTNLFENSAGNYSEFAQVLSDEVKICTFETEKFKAVLDNNPRLSANYSAFVNEKLVSFQQKYSDLIFKTPKSRVANFFLQYSKHHGTLIGLRVEMEMLLTHQEISDYIASSRQSVTIAINELADAGIIIYETRKHVIIPDINLLKQTL